MKNKTLIIFLILITLINTIIPAVNAVTIIEKANLINDHSMRTHIMQENENGWFEVICNYICYNNNGKKYPAYCIEYGINGVDEEGSYTVTTDKLLTNNKIYNIILNGYPYKSPSQLGVETVDDAYVATKHAIYSVMLNRNVKTYYKPMDAKGEKIINAIYNISEKGKVGTSINRNATVSVTKVGDLVESANGYYQEYSVTSDAPISKYNIENIENFSVRSHITDTKGEKKDNFLSGENFRVTIPKADLNKNINGKINVVATCKTNPIFLGEASNSKIQDYAITYNEYADYKKTEELNIETNTGSIKIVKKDTETLEPIKNVVFGLYNEQDEQIGTQTTNLEGIAIFSNLYQGKYKIKETTENINYIKDDTVYEINTEYNKQVSRIITNTHKKGNLKIIKVDKDDNTTTLEGIEFDLIDSNSKLVAHLITDENGEVVINNINIGKYTLKETKTKEEYNLCIDNNIEVKYNETTQIKIENEKKKGQIKIVKQDAENSGIKLEGVEFAIINNNNEIVDTVVTDSNGIAISSRLPIGDYTIKETSLGKNNQYILNEEIHKVKVEDEKINEIIIKNMHKKGNLKITKVDKDDNTLTLGAIEFDLINEKGAVINHLITDVNGEVYIENINTGIYTLKETKTKREYNLCENTDIVVEWNKTSEIVIENEKKKGQIKIIKQDAQKEEMKLEGVKFHIIDINNKVVEEIETNNDGEAISSKLLTGDYKIKEIDLGDNTDYLLNNEIHTVQVENESVSEIIVENEHKKGSFKIKKVDKDNNSVVLEGVEFQIIDKDGYIYKAITNKDGIAEVQNIRVGKVEIKEIKTKENYVLSNEIYHTEVKEKESNQITIQNEKKKGQVEIYKTDKENKKVKIPNVEFEVLDKNYNFIDKMVTDESGYCISKKIPIGNYYLREVKNNGKYVLNQDIIEIKIDESKVLKLNIENEKIKGKIKIIKTSSNDSPILNKKQGDFLSEVVFEIFDFNNNVVDTLVTDEAGESISKELEIGRYKVVEKSTNKYYILNPKEYMVNIEKNNEIKTLNIQNEAVIPKLDIEKTGEQFAEKNEEIKYEFDIRNISNTKLDNFTWTEYIPYEDCKITKMVTGIYSEDLDYSIYYKTNKTEYKLFKTVNSLTSQYLDFNQLNLLDEEIITEIKVEYKTVSKDFMAIVKPCIFTKVDNDAKKDDKITNITKLSGNIEEYVVEDKSSFETIIKEKEILKKLPKTGC